MTKGLVSSWFLISNPNQMRGTVGLDSIMRPAFIESWELTFETETWEERTGSVFITTLLIISRGTESTLHLLLYPRPEGVVLFISPLVLFPCSLLFQTTVLRSSHTSFANGLTLIHTIWLTSALQLIHTTWLPAYKGRDETVVLLAGWALCRPLKGSLLAWVDSHSYIHLRIIKAPLPKSRLNLDSLVSRTRMCRIHWAMKWRTAATANKVSSQLNQVNKEWEIRLRTIEDRSKMPTGNVSTP